MIGYKVLDLTDNNFRGSCSQVDYREKMLFRKDYFSYGLNFGFNIYQNLSLNLNGNFSKRTEPICDRGIVGYSELRFQNYSFAFLPKYRIRNFVFGGGLNLNHFKNFRLGKEREDIWGNPRGRNNHEQFGWIASVGYYYYSFLLEFRYSDSHFFGEKIWRRYDKGQSYELTIGYQFNFKEVFKNRNFKDKCPAF